MPDQENWQGQAWQQPGSGSNIPPSNIPPNNQPQAQMPPFSGAQYAYTAPPYAAAYAAPTPAPAKGGKGWIVGLSVVVAIFLLCAIGMFSCTSMVNTSLSTLSGSSSSTSLDYLTSDAVAVITIDGTIQYDGSSSSPEGLKALLDAAEANSNIKAVVLRVDSGGGLATAGEEMATYVSDFSKPIVVSSASTNASAAYLISSQADYIYTAKTTSIGSIGTAIEIVDLSGLYEKLGINIEDITSSESKDSSYGNRSLTDEEREYYQQLVDDINDTFIESVAEGRGMTIEEVQELATGMVFTGMTAVENGLADEIGTLEDAIAKAAELAGISDYSTVSLTSSSSTSVIDLLDLLSLFSSSISVNDLYAYVAVQELEN